MLQLHSTTGSSAGAFVIVPSKATEGLARDVTRRFLFRVPPRWRSPIPRNPFAAAAERQVIQWLEALGCTTRGEVERGRTLDTAGHVGIPFPSLSRPKTVRIARYLSLWRLWQDGHVDAPANRWRINAGDVIGGYRPEGMTRFDEGWWQLVDELAATRSARWLDDLCQTMSAWCVAAVEEAAAMLEYRARGVVPGFAAHIEMRTATAGMYATARLLEDAYDFELPQELRCSPTVARLILLANKIVGLGKDILSFGKDCVEGRINLVSTLMHERGTPVDEALVYLLRMHHEALEEYDRLADSVGKWSREADPIIARWLQDLRYASLGFSLWESQAPRHAVYKVVTSGRVIEPGFSFFPPPCDAPPSSRHRAAPPSSRRYSAPRLNP